MHWYATLALWNPTIFYIIFYSIMLKDTTFFRDIFISNFPFINHYRDWNFSQLIFKFPLINLIILDIIHTTSIVYPKLRLGVKIIFQKILPIGLILYLAWIWHNENITQEILGYHMANIFRFFFLISNVYSIYILVIDDRISEKKNFFETMWLRFKNIFTIKTVVLILLCFIIRNGLIICSVPVNSNMFALILYIVISMLPLIAMYNTIHYWYSNNLDKDFSIYYIYIEFSKHTINLANMIFIIANMLIIRLFIHILLEGDYITDISNLDNINYIGGILFYIISIISWCQEFTGKPGNIFSSSINSIFNIKNPYIAYINKSSDPDPMRGNGPNNDPGNGKGPSDQIIPDPNQSDDKDSPNNENTFSSKVWKLISYKGNGVTRICNGFFEEKKIENMVHDDTTSYCAVGWGKIRMAADQLNVTAEKLEGQLVNQDITCNQLMKGVDLTHYKLYIKSDVEKLDVRTKGSSPEIYFLRKKVGQLISQVVVSRQSKICYTKDKIPYILEPDQTVCFYEIEQGLNNREKSLFVFIILSHRQIFSSILMRNNCLPLNAEIFNESMGFKLVNSIALTPITGAHSNQLSRILTDINRETGTASNLTRNYIPNTTISYARRNFYLPEDPTSPNNIGPFNRFMQSLDDSGRALWSDYTTQYTNAYTQSTFFRRYVRLDSSGQPAARIIWSNPDITLRGNSRNVTPDPNPDREEVYTGNPAENSFSRIRRPRPYTRNPNIREVITSNPNSEQVITSNPNSEQVMTGNAAESSLSRIGSQEVITRNPAETFSFRMRRPQVNASNAAESSISRKRNLQDSAEDVLQNPNKRHKKS